MQDYLIGIKTAYSGMTTTLAITSVAVILGVAVGLLMALMKLSGNRFLKGIATVYIEIIRGTPLLVQALIIYFGLPQVLQSFGIAFRWENAIVASMLVCGLNSAAYMAEIVRAGIQAIDKGQMEAARSLGMTHKQAMRLIIIPQAFKVIIPPLGNEFITLIKETAVLSAITVTEITRASMLWASSTFNAWPAYLGTAFVYLSLTIPLSIAMNRLERRISKNVKG
ncbi:MAG: amino acid ABC transporter permease [Eubacteriales bacterium]|nr:amino acid ABC transporter permease [Eubacteriales bacterium]MDY3332664.1 amino acid ABC transporter permease [Gallibacter sp.]